MVGEAHTFSIYMSCSKGNGNWFALDYTFSAKATGAKHDVEQDIEFLGSSGVFSMRNSELRFPSVCTNNHINVGPALPADH